jgi:hypothetical protein
VTTALLVTTSLQTLIETASPRERSGSQTSARYDFQTNFAILKLVELREGAQDFRVVVDLFDDLMVLDSALAPTAVRFYQIKSKDAGDWIMSDCVRKSAARHRAQSCHGYMHICQCLERPWWRLRWSAMQLTG